MLQYTVYAVMIPFLGMGTDQLAERAVGKPGTENNVKLRGDDETDEKAHAVKNVRKQILGFETIVNICRRSAGQGSEPL